MKSENHFKAICCSVALVIRAKDTVSDRHTQLSFPTTGEQHGLNDGRVASRPDAVLRRAQGQLCAVGKKQVLKAGHDVVIVGYVHIHCAVHAERKWGNPELRSLDVSWTESVKSARSHKALIQKSQAIVC